MFKVNFSFDKCTQNHIWTCLKSTTSCDRICLKLYLDIFKVNFSLDKHIQSHIWIFLESTFPLTNIFKVTFGHI
jgi:hypothetical protein